MSAPAGMRASAISELAPKGGLGSRVAIRERPVPEPGPGQVRVRVAFAAINIDGPEGPCRPTCFA